MTSISLITASYNSARTIADTLKSVAFQDYPGIEHIIVDGASKDDTLKVIDAHRERVAKLVSEKDKGIYDAYNKGLKLATAPIIGFINSDDLYSSPKVISEVMAAFADPSIDAVHGDLVYVNKDDITKITRHWRSRPSTFESLRRGFLPAHPTLFLRRSVYERAGCFDTQFRLAADAEFMIRIFKTHRIKSRHIPSIWVRMRNGGATGGSLASLCKQNGEIRHALAQHGVKTSAVSFFAHKAIDRSLQKLRARKLVLPPEATLP